jgi:hypothetical protein
MAYAPKTSHCAWQGTFPPPMTNMQERCCTEEINYLWQFFWAIPSHLQILSDISAFSEIS